MSGSHDSPPGSYPKPEAVPWKRGAVYAAGVFLVGYALTYLATTTVIAMPHYEVGTVQSTGWVFANAHQVPVSFSGRSLNIINGIATNGFGVTGPQQHARLLFLVPPALLAVAGYRLVQTDAYRVTSVTSAARLGATLAGGYLLVTVVAVVLIFSSSSADATTGPPLIQSVLLMGLGYPVLCGGLGGYLAER